MIAKHSAALKNLHMNTRTHFCGLYTQEWNSWIHACPCSAPVGTAEQFSNVAVQVHSLPAERERPSYSTFQPTLALPVSLVSHTAGPQGKPMLLAGATLGQAIWGGRRVKGMPGSALSGPLREDRDCSQEQRLRRELTSAVQKGASSLHPSPTLKGPRTSCAA